MKAKRLIALATALLLVCGLPLSAFAAEYDLAEGSVSIEARSDGQYVTHGSSSEVQDSAPVITGTTNFHSVTITAAADTTANVTLSGVNMNTIGAAIQTTGDGNVTIELDGTNTVQSGYTHAGVEKDNGGNLTITDGNDTAGSLTATGGRFGAGIGGGYGDSGENITVTGSAHVTANGGTSAAGIGGGGGDRESVAGGNGSNIKISGDAVVEANGGDGIPYSGAVRADLGAGAGIGGGGSLRVSGNGTGITITDNAHVTANGGDSYFNQYSGTESDGGGAGIGGGGGGKLGDNSEGTGGSGSGIEISGENTVVTATGGVKAAGIGGGDGGSGSGITITDNAEVTATGNGDGAGIGGGYKGSGSKITISGNTQVDATGNGEGAGIGGGQSGSGSSIIISGSAKVDADSSCSGAGIGGGQWGSGSGITITDNAKVTAHSSLCGAGIGGGQDGNGSSITIGGSADVAAHSSYGGAGIGGGQDGSGSGIAITENAKVTAHSDRNGAGIGGGISGSGRDITVSGNAQVKAQGGESVVDHFLAAGAGAGAAIGNGGIKNNHIPEGYDISNLAGTEAELTTDAPQAGNSYGLYAGALAGGWIAKYAPSANMDTGIPNSVTYMGRNGVATSDSVTLIPEEAPSCVKDGHTSGFQCGNDQVGIVTIQATGHNVPSGTPHNDATCTTLGTMTGYCTNCQTNATVTDPNSRLKDHSFTTYTPDPANLATCTQAGTKTAVCDVCHVATNTIPDPAKNHSFTNYIPDGKATCTQDGSKIAQCDNSCGATDTKTDVGSALGHSFTNYVSNNDATYLKDGTRTAKCDHTGCDATDTITDPGTRLPAPAFQLRGQDGKVLNGKTEQKNGVLTVTVDADLACLTGYLGGLQALKAQGVGTIVFVTNRATSTFAVADLMATMTAGDSYTLTHDGESVTFTLGNGSDISGILK